MFINGKHNSIEHWVTREWVTLLKCNYYVNTNYKLWRRNTKGTDPRFSLKQRKTNTNHIISLKSSKAPSLLQLHILQQAPAIKSWSIVSLHVLHIATAFVLHLPSLYNLWKRGDGDIAARAVESSDGESFLLRIYHGPMLNASKPPIAQNLHET